MFDPLYPDDHAVVQKGTVVVLLPSYKRTHHKSMQKHRSVFNLLPKEGLLNFLFRYYPPNTALELRGDLLMCLLISKTLGTRIAVFPGFRRVSRKMIQQAGLLALADEDVKEVSFYIAREGQLEKADIPWRRAKAQLTFFSLDLPHIAWVRSNKTIKKVIEGYYVDEHNLAEILNFPSVKKEKLSQSKNLIQLLASLLLK